MPLPLLMSLSISAFLCLSPATALTHLLPCQAFESKYDAVGEQQGDHTKLAALHEDLKPFLLRRVKKDVEKSLPAKVSRAGSILELRSANACCFRWSGSFAWT